MDYIYTNPTFTRTFFLYAISPQLVIPALFAISALALVPRIPFWGKCVGQLTAMLLTIYLVLATPIASSILMNGLTLFLQPYAGESADVVVLCRGNELGFNRYDLTIQLWKQVRVPKVFVTGLSRIRYVTDRFEQESLPLKALTGSTCDRTTYEEAMSAAKILQSKQADEVILITDSAHM